jgi:hypothetical protein
MDNIKIYGVPSQEVKEITEEQKNVLVDLDLAWFDGKDWCFIECADADEYFRTNINPLN